MGSPANTSGSEIAPIVVTSHTTSVVANQEGKPSMVSPCVDAAARPNARMVTARPLPPRSNDAYPWGNFKINNDRIRCAAENTRTATMNPDADIDTRGTTHAATNSPIANDPRSTTARARFRLMMTSVGVRLVGGKD
jgi:hypothetical protein